MITLRLFGGVALLVDSRPVTGPAAQRRRIALLALLAASPTRAVSRDKLVAYFWPDEDRERARHFLADSLSTLRKALGKEAVLTVGDDLVLNGDVVRCDVSEFVNAVQQRDAERAVALFQGPFLDGFFVSDAPEFERWVEAERRRLSEMYASSLEALATGAEGSDAPERAVQWWGRLAAHDPLSSRAALRFMDALSAAGDRARAIQHARVHAALLREELDADPDPEVEALAARLSQLPDGPAARTPPPLPTTPAAVPPDDGVHTAPAAPPPGLRRPRRTTLVALAVTLVLVAGGLFALLGRAGVTVGDALSPRQGRNATASSTSADPRAQELYLRGVHHLNRRNPTVAVEYLEQAIVRDPDFAHAHAALAQAYYEIPPLDADAPVGEVMRRATRAAHRALELDPSLADARVVLGFILYRYYWRFADGEREVLRAIDLAPGYAYAYEVLATIQEHAGRTEEAMANIRRAQDLDPMRAHTACLEAYLLLHARRYEQALEQLADARREHDAPCGEAWIESYAMLGRYDDAIEAARALYERERPPSEAELLTRMAEDILGAKRDGRPPTPDLIRAVDESELRMEPFHLAKWYTAAGDHDAALTVLERMADDRHATTIWITFPYFDPLRPEPRYQALLDRMGMPSPPR